MRMRFLRMTYVTLLYLILARSSNRILVLENVEEYDDEDGEDHDGYADGVRHGARHVGIVDCQKYDEGDWHGGQQYRNRSE